MPPRETLLFDTDLDPDELENRAGAGSRSGATPLGTDEREMAEALAEELSRIGAPADLRERLQLV